ncbi:MAG: hypothetical protein ACRDPF_19300 [Streptosporangiaceae bacterium]
MAAQRAQAGRERRARRITWLLLVTAILRDRRFHESVVFGAIMLAALAGLGREMNSRSFERARAWLGKLDEQAAHAIKAAGEAAGEAAEKAVEKAKAD